MVIISGLDSDEWVTNDSKVRVFEKKLRASVPIFQYSLEHLSTVTEALFRIHLSQ